MSFLGETELKQIGFRYLGNNVKLSDKTSIYNPSSITIHDNARIDDFCILSAGHGGIEIGRYVHIACYCSLIGSALIRLGDFVGISGRTSIYSSNDDYSGQYLTNPNIPDQFKNVTNDEVVLEKHALVGVGSIILPGVHMGQGAVVGAHSLVKKDCESFMIYVGNPAKPIKERSRKLLELEKQFTEHPGRH
ncbi:MAG: acyltransferase [Anaerohalosphaeraceae bacterium]